MFILWGLREGEFPRSKNENWIYSDGERGYLSSVGVELDNTACAYAEDKFFLPLLRLWRPRA